MSSEEQTTVAKAGARANGRAGAVRRYRLHLPPVFGPQGMFLLPEIIDSLFRIIEFTGL